MNNGTYVSIKGKKLPKIATRNEWAKILDVSEKFLIKEQCDRKRLKATLGLIDGRLVNVPSNIRIGRRGKRVYTKQQILDWIKLQEDICNLISEPTQQISLSGEIWKRIQIDNPYWISNKGRVWSEFKRGLLRPSCNRDGYNSVVLQDGLGGKLTVYVHILVFEHFNGLRKEGTHVHHINKSKQDNRPENLVLMNNKEHARFHRRVSVKLKYCVCPDCGARHIRKKAKDFM